ncbi:MAG: undecaprenyl-diphosphate phosphatase [Opitutaceae bacterium]|nr:undecaprenyl-diphosphate phosphatase [Opitutaceae bacterium]
MRSLLLFLALAWGGLLLAAEPVPPPAAELSVSDAIILGTIEGVTEYLPVSSTGHLIIANTALHLGNGAQLRNAAGQPLWYKPPVFAREAGLPLSFKQRALDWMGLEPAMDDPQGVPLTLKLAADSYTVIIQFGAIAAVAVLYWSQFMAMLRGLLGRDRPGLRLLVNLAIAFLPAAVVGLLLHDWIDAHLFSVRAVIAAQIAGAGLMWWVERWRQRRAATGQPGLALEKLSARQSVGIGLLQCVALWPGTSRSMMTIVGGYAAGLEPRRAAEFSFLLGFVTLSAAALFKSWTDGAAMIEVFGWPHVLLGCAVAAVVAAVCVRFLITWLTRHGLMIFVWYRLGVAAVLGVLLAVGYLH